MGSGKSIDLIYDRPASDEFCASKFVYGGAVFGSDVARRLLTGSFDSKSERTQVSNVRLRALADH